MRDVGIINKKLAMRLKNNGVYFSEKLLGLRLHFYQKEVMNEDHRFIAMCWSRQLGKTTLLSVKAVHKAVTFTPTSKKREFLIMILSQDRERAREFYNLVIGHIQSNPLLANMIDGDAKQSETKLVNGARIINKAAGRDGRSLRGYSVDLLIIDEADFIPEPVFTAGEQCTASTRGAIWLISTPYKKATTFYKYFSDGMEARDKWNDPGLLEPGEEKYEEPIGRKYGFKTYWHDYTSGLKADKPDGSTQIDESFVEKKRKSMAKWAFEQEYLAKWSDDIAAYFNEKQIRDCIDYDLTPESYRFNKQWLKQHVFVGIDFAKHKDRTVLWAIGKQTNGEYHTIFTYEMEGRDWNRQLAEINVMMHQLKPTYIFVDKTGLGDVMFDLMSKSDIMPDGNKNHMLGYVQEVTMTLQRKSSIYMHLQYLIGNRLITIPNHPRAIRELIYLQYEKSQQSEWVKIYAPESGEDDLHDDYPDALALACQGTVDDVMFIPVSMMGIRKGMGAIPVAKTDRERAQHNPLIDKMDAWEFQQVHQRGAKFNIMGATRSNNKVGNPRRGTYKRRGVRSF